MLEHLRRGDVPAKPHTAFYGEGGALRYEECFTRRGFDGAYSILYHLHRPHLSELVPHKVEVEVLRAGDETPLVRRHFRSDEVPSRGTPLTARAPLLFNSDVVLSVLSPHESSPSYFVNADADELYFLREGSARLICPLGELAISAHDYLIVPKGMLHRFEIPSGTRQRWLLVECLGGIFIPQQYRNEVGQLRMDAPYSHRDFEAPTFKGPVDEGIRQLIVKKGGRRFTFHLPHSPLDVVGWDGAVYPVRFPISRFSPRVGQVHLPPTVHGTFAAKGALICSFVPRMLDFGEGAIPCPYPHSSVDVDEVIYYCDGNFSSRKGVGPGSISLHPAGIAHGPHQGAYEGSIGQTRTEELAVMLDCFGPLHATEAARGCEDGLYHTSF